MTDTGTKWGLIILELLERLADARELVDVNIAAGIALQELADIDELAFE
jgi:hypothetical protein